VQTAEILFFVIDNQTRSVASVIEAAYLAGQHCCFPALFFLLNFKLLICQLKIGHWLEIFYNVHVAYTSEHFFV